MESDNSQIYVIYSCRNCGKIIDPKLWLSIQITKYFFWWFCSTNCMKCKKIDAQREAVNLSLDIYDWNQ